MKNFQYMDYAEVNRRLNDLVNNPKTKIKVIKEEPLGMTDFLLPIDHYTIGNGSKHIIVTGSYHSAEIITTIFIVKLMEDLALNQNNFNPDEYTIDFIPIMNPEGYLITTSMQNLYLEKGKTDEEKIALAKDYWRIYREDAAKTIEATRENDIESLRSKKGYQVLFDDVDMDRFLKNYPDLKESIMEIINKNDYPIGVCAAWSANGHGIDLSQNAPFNSSIEKFKKRNEPIYSGTAYSNIRKDIPGPINCPCRDLNNFTFESENLHLLNFLANLNATKGEEIVAFINYHSVMGKIYQRPVAEKGIIDLYNIDYIKKIIENYTGARTFKEENAYDIIESNDPYNYINEYFRLRYGINIQLELSRMGSNPIGPLADNYTFEEVTIKPNIEAFKNFVKNINFIKEYSRFINYLIEIINKQREIEAKETLAAKDIYRLIDYICQNYPTLYTKLRNEIINPYYNNHIISYLYKLIEEKTIYKSESETNELKENINLSNFENPFIINYVDFLKRTITKINEDRIMKNKEMLNSSEIEQLIDNISKDYPEIFARLKKELSNNNYNKEIIDILYKHLESILDNQMCMGNLII